MKQNTASIGVQVARDSITQVITIIAAKSMATALQGDVAPGFVDEICDNAMAMVGQLLIANSLSEDKQVREKIQKELSEALLGVVTKYAPNAAKVGEIENNE